MDYYQDDILFVKKHFNLEQILEFMGEHKVEVLLGEDCCYHCHIDYKRDGDSCVYGTGLTFFSALITGIKQYIKYNESNEEENNTPY